MSVYSTVSTLANSTTGESSTDTGSVLTLRSNQIQIGNLEYDDIKQSIITFLQRGSEDGDPNNPLKDYDFSSSQMGLQE